MRWSDVVLFLSGGFGGAGLTLLVQWLRYRSWPRDRDEPEYDFDDIVVETLKKRARGEQIFGIENLIVSRAMGTVSVIDRKEPAFWNNRTMAEGVPEPEKPTATEVRMREFARQQQGYRPFDLGKKES